MSTAQLDERQSFATAWKTDRTGRETLRAMLAGSSPTAAQAASDATARVTVYKPAVATFFGPGFYGKKTACGQKLTRRLLGVAHRTLPCGTLVGVYYRGHEITVPVVDRGPFRKGTTWDLTAATAKAVGMTSTSKIGTLRVPSAR